MTPLENTTLQQTLAADPARSAFVLANAGSGKTRVLTNRVARLLADGVDPQKILCITFTKAASVEMTERLFDLLGKWSFFDDAALSAAFKELEGDDYRSRSADELSMIRVLFARALETPGGLKIQTIHSFCEYALKRFPLEAGVAPGFSVLEETEASKLLASCIDHLAAKSAGQGAGPLQRLSGQMYESELRAMLRKLVSGPGASQLFFGNLARALDVDVTASEDTLVFQNFWILFRCPILSAQETLFTNQVETQRRLHNFCRNTWTVVTQPTDGPHWHRFFWSVTEPNRAQKLQQKRRTTSIHGRANT